MTITGDTVKSAVSLKLSAAYPGIPIYKEKIAQGAQRPFFSIRQLDVLQDKLMGEKYNSLFQVQVCYYSTIDDLELASHLDTKGLELLEILRTIDVEVGDTPETKLPVKGIQKSYKPVDDVLQVFVSYPLRLYIPKEPVEKMNKLTVTTTITGG